MRALTTLSIVVLLTGIVAAQDADRDFSGTWRLNPAKSDIRSTFDVPSGFLRVTRSDSVMTVAASAAEGEQPTTILYPLGAGKSEHSQTGGLTYNVATKWEGAAMLTNTIVGGKDEYTLSERWVRTRDGSRLTITRTVERRGSAVESTLAYDNPVLVDQSSSSTPAVSSLRQTNPAPQTPRPESEYDLEAGTRILLRLSNPLNTKYSSPGDRIYLQTATPVFVKGRLVIPQGSYVVGTVTESQRGGRVKGRSGLNFRFDTLTLPNGVSRDFRSRAGSVDARGNLDRTEGRVTGEATKGKDAGTVAKTTAAGTGIGSIAGAVAGNSGMGLGIGAAAGAVAGLAGVFGSRGQDVVIPQGATMEMVLDREVRFTDSELVGRNQ